MSKAVRKPGYVYLDDGKTRTEVPIAGMKDHCHYSSCKNLIPGSSSPRQCPSCFCAYYCEGQDCQMKHAKEHEPMCKQTRMLMMGDLLKHPIVDPDEPPPNDPSWEDVEVLDQAIKLLWVSISKRDVPDMEATIFTYLSLLAKRTEIALGQSRRPGATGEGTTLDDLTQRLTTALTELTFPNRMPHSDPMYLEVRVRCLKALAGVGSSKALEVVMSITRRDVPVVESLVSPSHACEYITGSASALATALGKMSSSSAREEAIGLLDDMVEKAIATLQGLGNELDNHVIKALNRLVRDLSDARRYRQAVEVGTITYERCPPERRMDTCFNLEEPLKALGRFDQAKDLITKAMAVVKGESDILTAHILLADLEWESNKPGQALAHATQVMDINSNSPCPPTIAAARYRKAVFLQALQIKANALEDLGRLKEAIEADDLGDHYNEAGPVPMGIRRGKYFLELGRRNDALAWLQSASLLAEKGLSGGRIEGRMREKFRWLFETLQHMDPNRDTMVRSKENLSRLEEMDDEDLAQGLKEGVQAE